MRVGLGRDLRQLGDDMRRGRAVGIAHAEVDDIAPLRPHRRAHPVHFGEDVGRQPLDAVEVGVHGAIVPPLLHCGKGRRNKVARAWFVSKRNPTKAAPP